MSKLSWTIAGGIGFLLGSRAGTAPYEKVASEVQRLRRDPQVRQHVAEAKEAAGERAAEAAQTVRTKVDEVTTGPGSATP